MVNVGAFVLVFVASAVSVTAVVLVSFPLSVFPLSDPRNPIQPAVAPTSASVALCRIVRRVVFELVVGIVHK